MNNIILTGFMGTGKTTIGRILAERLNRPFIDTDDYITAQVGKTIPQIFAESGEVGFRALEAQAARDLAAQQGLVISTGGGMLVNDVNRQILGASGLLVCLVARTEVIAGRLAHDTNRPLASNWQAIYEARRAVYASMPHQIDTSDLPPHTLTEQIITLWQQST